MENDNNKRQVPQKSVLTIRFLVGCYLLYTDYSLIEGAMSRQGGERIVIIAFMVLFLVAGGFLIVHSGRLLWEDWRRERNGGDVPAERGPAVTEAVAPEIETSDDVTGSSDTEENSAADEKGSSDAEADIEKDMEESQD